MGSITDMGLYVWDGATDPYNYQQLAQNWEILTFHDHTPGRGAQITAGGLAPGSVGLGNLDTTAQNFITSQGLTVRTSVTASTNVQPSEMIVVTGGTPLTATLPSPVANTRVAIVAALGASLSAPVTVQRSSGAIFGPKLVAATSFLLASNGAFVVLEADGVNWLVIAGGPDNGGYTVVGSPMTAAHGQVLNVVGTTTITLPTAPATGTTITVRNGNLAPTVVTVSAGTGRIFGPGCFNVTSIQLATTAAFVTLVGDPLSNWAIVAGQQDSGWRPLPLPTNVNPNAGFYVPSYRLLGDTVYLAGEANNNTGGIVNTLGALSSPYIPAQSVLFPTATGPGVGSLIIANPSGNMNCQIPVAGYIEFDGLNYRLS